MDSERKCIYCGVSQDLSESDIIPDALTNARITNQCVCRTNHNNKFSDMFESKVIKDLAFITNNLDIKSKKGKKFASYSAEFEINGVDYEMAINSPRDIFDGRILKSKDDKHILGEINKVKKIAVNPEQVTQIDVNGLMIKEKVRIDPSVYFSMEIFRMVAKIAFEWYCARNNVDDYHEEFSKIIKFITTGEGKNPVTILQDEDLYRFYHKQVELGNHCLIGFINQQGHVNVVFSLFGIIMYRIVVCELCPSFCENNFLYTELRVDAGRKEITQKSYELAEEYFRSYFLDFSKYTKGSQIMGLDIMICKEMPKIDPTLYPFALNMIKFLSQYFNETEQPNNQVKKILIENIERIMKKSILHRKTLKRFVKEYFHDNEKMELNFNTMNAKTIFLFYIVFIIGKNDLAVTDNNSLYKIIRKELNIVGNTVEITKEIQKRIEEKLISTPDYVMIMKKGAKIIQSWQ